ncbi:MAG: hypothetical protein P2A85_28305 [Microcoleus anatoxicus]
MRSEKKRSMATLKPMSVGIVWPWSSPNFRLNAIAKFTNKLDLTNT